MSTPRLTRRGVLAGLGIAATGAASIAAAGCSSPPPSVVEALRRGFHGRILQGGDVGWLERAVPTAQRYGATPQLIAECASTKDVQRAYRFARDNDWPFAIRGGGHNYAGFSSTDGLLISPRGLDTITVDASAQTITLGAGVLAGPAVEEFERVGAGLAIPIGRCNGVGIVGLTLGGGWGFHSRLYGLVADSLLSTQMITPDGELRTVSADEHPDLFWALRGGGGGNFGITTSLTFRALEVPPRQTVFQFVWMEENVIPDVIHALMELMVAAPRELTMEPVTSPRYNVAIPDLTPPNPVSLTTTGQYTGPRAEFDELIRPLITRYPPVGQEVIETDFWRAHQYLADSTPIGWFSVYSGFADRAVSRTGVDDIIAHAVQWPVGSVIPDSNWGCFSLGGAVGDIAPDATAFPHRGAELMFKYETSWVNSDEDEHISAGLEWLERFYADTRQHLNPSSAYVNFCNRDQPDALRTYYGANLERLVAVKRQWDPDNAFRFAQSIPTTL